MNEIWTVLGQDGPVIPTSGAWALGIAAAGCMVYLFRNLFQPFMRHYYKVTKVNQRILFAIAEEVGVDDERIRELREDANGNGQSSRE